MSTVGFPPGKGVPNPKGSREGEEERIGLFSQQETGKRRTTAAHTHVPHPSICPSRRCRAQARELNVQKPQNAKKGGKASQVLNFQGWGAESLTQHRGRVPASRQGAVP